MNEQEPTVLEELTAVAWAQERTRKLSSDDVEFMLRTSLHSIFVDPDLPVSVLARRLAAGERAEHCMKEGRSWVRAPDGSAWNTSRGLLAWIRGEES